MWDGGGQMLKVERQQVDWGAEDRGAKGEGGGVWGDGVPLPNGEEYGEFQGATSPENFLIFCLGM